ncbi:DUF559 domain-containing protein [Thermostichus vulcanus]|uniref:DUF559 domain-containing protein n=1 Tax=Thermostichus vulcanus str. 'Rupite' TaxID=2813851 RepID=A0ABT0C701_THEVL|nr:DUF559 domain-containing protein [Thermostichus vulcanus]MCJ2541569.1 DUF559 domain-containing protein [Thermostichus vulcanus str. 'Rupite']
MNSLVAPDRPEETGHLLRTTLMLKVLSTLTPGFHWTTDWLHANVRGSEQPFQFGPYRLSYKGQPGGRGTEHQWCIFSEDSQHAQRLEQIVNGILTRSRMPVPIAQPQTEAQQAFSFQGMTYRSPAEVAIAKVLEARGIPFFPNARCRIVNRSGITLTQETDFLVFVQGKARILEVDGREFHQDAAADHQRDRLFALHGLPTYRFSAQECLYEPEEVVNEFLVL